MGGSSQSKELKYCYALPNSKQTGFSPLYRNPLFKDQLTSTPFPQLNTYRDVVVNSCLKKFSSKNMAGSIDITIQKKGEDNIQHRTVKPYTYKQCFDKAELLGKGILGKKLEFTEKTQGMKFIGIFAKNRIEWLWTDLACTLFGFTSVPLYDTLGLENLSYCLNQTEMTTLFLTEATLKVLLDLKDHGKVKNLVLFDRIDQSLVKKANGLKFNVLDFETLVQQGKSIDIDYNSIKVKPEDIHTFSYTSGTTGPPKGAMLTHRNFNAFLAAFNNNQYTRMTADDTYLSFLPLPHVFQRVVITANILVGSFIVFYSGDMFKIKDDCQVVRPTVFVAVPRLYNRIVEKVQQQFQQKTGVIKCLIESGVSSKMDSMKKDGSYKNGFYDSIIFSKVRQGFGGRIRQMITGSAPITKKTFQFMQMIMSAPMYEGYGQTENTAAAFVRSFQDPQMGHVGSVVSSLQFKLLDIPQMKYTSDDKDEKGRSTPRGQIWLRGPAVFSGYYKLKDKTEQAITKDGWLKTGDVGMLTADSGAMKIIDRKKNIFKLQQGQYVAPEKVQIFYGKCPYIEEVFLHGQSTHSFCVAVVKPHQEHFLDLAKKNNMQGDYESLCNDNNMRKILIKELFSQGKAAGLNTFQQAKNIFIESKPFADKKILTNTMKLQRFEAKTVYRNQIDKMYGEGELPIK